MDVQVSQNWPGHGALVRLSAHATPARLLGLLSRPGMYNALSGLGGGGQVNAKDNNKGAIAIYTTFSVVGFFAGPSQPTRNQVDSELRWTGILCLRLGSPLLQPYSKLWIPHLRWDPPWCLRWTSLVRSRRDHDVLPRGGIQGEIYFLVLDDLQLGRSHRIPWYVTFCHNLKPQQTGMLTRKQIPLGQNLHSDSRQGQRRNLCRIHCPHGPRCRPCPLFV